MNGHKFCGHCGSEIKTEEKFCGNCGNPVEQPATQVVQLAPKTPAAQPTPVTPAPIVPAQAPISTPKKSGNKKPLIFAAIAVVLVALIGGVAFAIIANLPKTRTVMVYMIGSNLESEFAAGSADLEEMINSKFDTEYTKVLVYTGGSKRWGMDEISANENAIFEVTPTGLQKVQTYDRKIMTKKEVLTEYIDFAYENYKSSYYDLVLWNHGGGPIVGYGSDEFSPSGSLMSLTDLKSAIADSAVIKSNKKFGFIGFDACLMGSIEVGTALKDYADYMVASEESEPGMGWNYEFLNVIDGKTETKDLGSVIVDKYIEHYDDYPYQVGLSLSVVDLKEIASVAESADKLFGLVDDELNTKNFSEYSRALTRKRVYGYDGRDNQSFDLVDLQDLASGVENKHPDEFSALKSSIEKAVIYSKTNMTYTNGLSVYFPTNNKSYAPQFVKRYEDVAYSDSYQKFLKKYVDLISGKRIVSRSTFEDLDEKKEGDGASVELPDELVENFQKAEIIVYRKLGENEYAPIYRGSNVSLDGKTLSTDDMKLQFVVTVKDKNGEVENSWISMYEKERNDEFVEYTSFGVLYYADDSALGFSPKSYEMHLRLKKGEKTAEVTDIRVQNSDDGLSGKVSFNPEDIIIIDMTVPTYKLFDDSGNRLDSLESTGKIYGSSISFEKGETYEISLENLDFDFGNLYEGTLEKSSLSDYYAEFIVYDTQGKSHRLNLIHI